MLQNPRFFAPVESELDTHKLQVIAASARAKLTLNETFFASSLPSLYQQIKKPSENRYRTYFTKFSNLNLFDEQTSQLLYENDPKTESEQSATYFLHRAVSVVNIKSESALYPLLADECKLFQGNQDKAFKVRSVHQSAEVIVVLGLGLGLFLETLLTQSSAKALIIYEKHLDIVRASMEVVDWQYLFQLATDNGISLFVQAGNNADSLKNDLNELNQALPFTDVAYYRHYPNIDYDRNFLAQLGKQLPEDHKYSVPSRACLDVVPASQTVAVEAMTNINYQKQRSFQLLQQHKPHMASFLADRTLKRWQAYINQHGQLNGLDCLTGWPLFSDHRDLDFFSTRLNDVKKFPATYRSQPSSESSRINYRYHQLITQFDTARQDCVQACDESSNSDKSLFYPSLLINGIGMGYELDCFIEQADIHELKIAVLLEPDEELLLLSLCASSWLEKLAKRIDLREHFTFFLDEPKEGYKQSFAAVFYTQYGSALASSLFFSPVHTDASKQAVKAYIRSHQQVMFAANYDDNRFHINHAIANLYRGAQLLSKRAQDRTTPIVLVGNGPSLDRNMAWIKHHADKAIIVSCGTSIYTLYKAGIVPDFHAELEIVKLVAEMKTNMPADKLKTVDLLATISSHPMLTEVFGDSFLIARGGLEVTQHLRLLGALPQNVTETWDGAPTCANLAACMFAEAGYQNLILCGIDLAAHDDGKHHASQSYYDDEGLQLLHGFTEKEYAGEHLLVEGYDGSIMVSKGEFIFAIEALGNLFARFPTIQVTNLSRGAKIPLTKWQDDQTFVLSSGTLDKAKFKTRFAKSFTYVEKPKGLYSEEHIHKLITDFSARFELLDKKVDAGQLSLFDYFTAFRDEVNAIDNDPAQLMIALFMRSSRFYESHVYAFATLYYERTDDCINEASDKAFAIAYEHWKRFCKVAIEDIKLEPYQLENSSLKDNKILVSN